METGPFHFVLNEQQVALRIGCSGDFVRDSRGPCGGRWQTVDGRILWSELGVAELIASIAPESAEKPPAVHQPPAVEILVVVACTFRNRKVMEASDTDGNVWPVWVADAHRFRPGMQVLAEKRPGKGLYDFRGNPEHPEAGPLLPRRPGRW